MIYYKDSNRLVPLNKSYNDRLIIEDAKSDKLSIPQYSMKLVDIPCRKSGYNPIGVAGWAVMGMLYFYYIIVSELRIFNDNVRITLGNSTGNNISDIQITCSVIYM